MKALPYQFLLRLISHQYIKQQPIPYDAEWLPSETVSRSVYQLFICLNGARDPDAFFPQQPCD